MDNIQLICNIINIMKSDLDQSEFIYWCKKVADKDRYRKEHKNFNSENVRGSTTLTSNFNRFISRHLYKTSRDAEKRSLTFNITKEDIEKLYLEQNGSCSLTGVEMTYIDSPRVSNDGKLKKANYKNLSIDRVDSSKVYSLDNIQLVCCIINRVKLDFMQNDFIEWCQNVADYSL